MVEWPNLCAMLLTFDRAEYAVRTIKGLQKHLRYSGIWTIHVADDGSPEGYIREITDGANAEDKAKGITTFYEHTNAEQRGYGASYNLATQVIHNIAEIILPIEDDWELQKPLDLDPLVRILLEDDRVNCIRLGYIGYTQELRAKFIWSEETSQNLLLLDPTSPEHHVWAGHPRLETREYQRKVGGWPEGIDPGMTEFTVSHNAEARKGVVWPLELLTSAGNLFAHIGAQQARQDQKVEA